jgi:hypothetical protein
MEISAKIRYSGKMLRNRANAKLQMEIYLRLTNERNSN